jgi:biopolymer transport protein ExbB
MLDILIDGREMMIPLLIFSVVAIAVILDRAVAFYHYGNIQTRWLRARVMELLEEGKVQQAAQLCADTPGPVSAVLLVGLQSYHKHRALASDVRALTGVMKEAMEDYSERALAAVEKRLTVLSTVGNAAPLLGMCGTVVGMIRSFSAMADQAAAGGGGAVADGIAEALITTAAGLIIALIAVIPYHYFNTKVDAIDLEINETVAELLDHVVTRVEPARAA